MWRPELLKKDPTLWTVTAWNDNGLPKFVKVHSATMNPVVNVGKVGEAFLFLTFCMNAFVSNRVLCCRIAAWCTDQIFSRDLAGS
jgi:hypothetical protein